MRGNVFEVHVGIPNPDGVFVLGQVRDVLGDGLNFARPVHEMPGSATELDANAEPGASILSLPANVIKSFQHGLAHTSGDLPAILAVKLRAMVSDGPIDRRFRIRPGEAPVLGLESVHV